MAVSGMGMTTSMEASSEGVRTDRMVSASLTPMFSRDLATLMESRMESGRAKYTYSFADRAGLALLKSMQVREC